MVRSLQSFRLYKIVGYQIEIACLITWSIYGNICSGISNAIYWNILKLLSRHSVILAVGESLLVQGSMTLKLLNRKEVTWWLLLVHWAFTNCHFSEFKQNTDTGSGEVITDYIKRLSSFIMDLLWQLLCSVQFL